MIQYDSVSSESSHAISSFVFLLQFLEVFGIFRPHGIPGIPSLRNKSSTFEIFRGVAAGFSLDLPYPPSISKPCILGRTSQSRF